MSSIKKRKTQYEEEYDGFNLSDDLSEFESAISGEIPTEKQNNTLSEDELAIMAESDPETSVLNTRLLREPIEPGLTEQWSADEQPKQKKQKQNGNGGGRKTKKRRRNNKTRRRRRRTNKK